MSKCCLQLNKVRSRILRRVNSTSGTSGTFSWTGLTVDTANPADGGGIGSTASVTLPAGGIAPGASVSIAFELAVDQGGRYSADGVAGRYANRDS